MWTVPSTTGSSPTAVYGAGSAKHESAQAEPCRFFLSGGCLRGETCPFSHEFPDERHLDVNNVGFIFNSNVQNSAAAFQRRHSHQPTSALAATQAQPQAYQYYQSPAQLLGAMSLSPQMQQPPAAISPQATGVSSGHSGSSPSLLVPQHSLPSQSHLPSAYTAGSPGAAVQVRGPHSPQPQQALGQGQPHQLPSPVLAGAAATSAPRVASGPSAGPTFISPGYVPTTLPQTAGGNNPSPHANTGGQPHSSIAVYGAVASASPPSATATPQPAGPTSSIYTYGGAVGAPVSVLTSQPHAHGPVASQPVHVMHPGMYAGVQPTAMAYPAPHQTQLHAMPTAAPQAYRPSMQAPPQTQAQPPTAALYSGLALLQPPVRGGAVGPIPVQARAEPGPYAPPAPLPYALPPLLTMAYQFVGVTPGTSDQAHGGYSATAQQAALMASLLSMPVAAQ